MPAPSPSQVPLAILGDSDSHAYQDRLGFPEGSSQRGGTYRSVSLQWIEVLARLRGTEIDPGPWGEWGVRRRVAQPASWFGLTYRTPRKEDFAFNFAWSGARCADLMEGPAAQVPHLVALMDAKPEAWRRGVVVARIGINDLGIREALEAFARDGDVPATRQRVDACLAHIEAAIDHLAARHPDTALLLFGVLDNVDWPRNVDAFFDAGGRARIAAALDRFDAGLRRIAAASPRRAFFDDRAFYRQRVGQRRPDGLPGYRSIPVLGGSGAIAFEASFAEGDAPSALYLADGHAGTVLNAHWAQAVSEVIAGPLDLPVTPITDAERDAFLIDVLTGVPAS